jgi:hypothetical protein
MQPNKRLRSHTAPIVLALAICATLFLAGCETIPISQVNGDPARYMDKDVTVAGQVINSFGVSFGTKGQGAFELDDGTGRLWVWSSGFGVPSQGARVSVTGRLQGGVTLGGKFFVNVLRETQPRKEA